MQFVYYSSIHPSLTALSLSLLTLSYHWIGNEDWTCNHCKISESGKIKGGRENSPWVELPFLISCMVMSAATVFLSMLCSAIASPSRPPLSAVSCSSMAGKTSSTMLSQSFTSSEMSSVMKNGCFKTFSMKGSLSSRPVRLSYFFKILASPAIPRILNPLFALGVFCKYSNWYISFGLLNGLLNFWRIAIYCLCVYFRPELHDLVENGWTIVDRRSGVK